MIDLTAALRACTPAERDLVARHAASAAEQTAARAPDSRVTAVWQALAALTGVVGAEPDPAELHRRAVAALTSFVGGFRGVVPFEQVEGEVRAAAGGFDPAELLLPLCGIALRLAADLANRVDVTLEQLLVALGREAIDPTRRPDWHGEPPGDGGPPP